MPALVRPSAAAGARPGVGAREDRAAGFLGVERQQRDRVLLVHLEALVHVGHVPAEMPDRGLRLRRRRRVDLREQHQDVVRRLQRRLAGKRRLRRARKLLRVEVDRRVRD